MDHAHGHGQPHKPHKQEQESAQREISELAPNVHPVGDFLEAHAWDLLEERRGFLRLRIHLPKQVKYPRGQLYGGFTPTYVDLIALLTCRAGESVEGPRRWLATMSMHIDYLDPITDEFRVESRLLRRRGRTSWVETRFLDDQGSLLANALTTLKEVQEKAPLSSAKPEDVRHDVNKAGGG